MMQSCEMSGLECLPEVDFAAEGNDAEQFSIDLDTFYQILDENSDPSEQHSFDLCSMQFPSSPVKCEETFSPEDVQHPKESYPVEGSLPRSIPSSSSLRQFESSVSMDKDLRYAHGNQGFCKDQGKPGISSWTDGNLPTSAPDCLTQSLDHECHEWGLAVDSAYVQASGGTCNQLLQNETFDWPAQSSKNMPADSVYYSNFPSYSHMIYSESEMENRFGLTKNVTSYHNVESDIESGLCPGNLDALSMTQLEEQERNLCTYSMTSIINTDASIPSCSELDNCHATVKCEASRDSSLASLHRGFTSVALDTSLVGHAMGQCFRVSHNPISILCDDQETYVKNDEGKSLFIPQSICSSVEIYLEPKEEHVGLSQPEIIDTITDMNAPNIQCDESAVFQGSISDCDGSVCCSQVLFHRNFSAVDGRNSFDHSSEEVSPSSQAFLPHKKLKFCGKDERGELPIVPCSALNYAGNDFLESVENSLSRDGSCDDSDADVCILQEINPRNRFVMSEHGRPNLTLQSSTFSEPVYPNEMGNMRLKASDRLGFRAALQGLSQNRSEVSPPEGVLAVPLLKHQRLALSWMVQKETTSMNCSGGILADDQGLGKTISTIALILLERPPSSRVTIKPVEQSHFKPLSLDDEEEDFHVKPFDATVEKVAEKRQNFFVPRKARPAAGTLVVCPTSVLRQWEEELRNKVTKEAKLSVLVYHGGNRTKDPDELAKHDVVLTTYSIVSMEVPKQPLVDQGDEERMSSGDSDLYLGFSSSRKRKCPPSKKGSKSKKGTDGALLESVDRPLARVGWFRVVLDEAQSIKNHRTQVARACWGLRAKRRWCLSGTPIQNAVDDLYSYFRFLRYDPYDGYKSFCSAIKAPIHRNPANGYKKLQAVLKTVMLRRTKGTLLDGKPIINLPPKYVSLKKVDFSEEERDFYSKLEAESRAQFKVYAAQGTVKQNYVNILLMLLRLRQACDHPLLVKSYDSNSMWRSSLETAKSLPQAKQETLLNCLEGRLAICTICNDLPEDAVVSLCGHVFCNQCVCEHLTGDENLCPAANCTLRLKVTEVFSKATLKSSLGEHFHDSSPDGSELCNTPEFNAEMVSSDSSKIKAALEILESISKPMLSTNERNCSLYSECISSCPEGASTLGADPNVNHDSHLHMSKDFSLPVAEKAIVFSQWTRMLDLLEARLKNSDIQYRRLDGTMSVVARDKAVKDFNNLPEVSVIIMSLKAASLGLNMVAACHVLLLDLWWNPTTEDQAIDRAHRIGQTRAVTVSRLTVKDTVEDRILALQEKKREMVASAFGEDEVGGRQTRLTVDDLEYLFMA